jgi:AAA domain, putative AbiEii toxin, Type IV TA system
LVQSAAMASRSKPAARKPRPSRPAEPARKPPSIPFLAEWVVRAGLGEEVRDALVKWLARQIVTDQFAKLEQGGQHEGGIPLRKVFVDLPISDQPVHDVNPHGPRRRFLETLLAMKPGPLCGPFDAFEPERIPARGPGSFAARGSAPAPRGPGFLVIGGPGQGKSTLGQLACQVHRAVLLEPFVDQLSPPQREVVRSFLQEQEKGQANEEIPEAPLFPLRIVLPEAAAWLANQGRAEAEAEDGGSALLLRWLSAQAKTLQFQLSPEALHRLLVHAPFLLVLDGLDEVGAAEDRASLVTSIRDLLASLREGDARGLVVATTRPQGYTGELDRIEVPLATVYLAPLTQEEALAYGKKLADARFPDQPEDHARVTNGLAAAAREPTTARLLTSPLQVTILAILAQQKGTLPRDRWGLYASYFETIYNRELSRGTYAAPLLRHHKTSIEEIHRRIGLLLQVEAEQAGGTEARVTRERLAEVTDTVLREDGIDDEARLDLVERIVRAAEQRLVFMVEPEPGKFGFEIRSLQEFMAAWALAKSDDGKVTEARLLQVAKAPMFRGVTLFVVSKLFTDRSSLCNALESVVCQSLDEDETDPTSKTTCAGSLLALEILAEGSCASQPKYERQLFDRACRLLDLPPSFEQVRLAWLTSSNTEKNLSRALTSRLRRPEDGTALGAWVALIEAASAGMASAAELGKASWNDVTNPAAILSACRSAEVLLSTWLAEIIEERPEKVLPSSIIDWYSEWYPSPLIDERTRKYRWPLALPALALEYKTARMAKTSLVRVAWRPIALRHNQTWLPIADMQAPPPQWKSWVIAAKFAKHPDASTLAASLIEMASLRLQREQYDDLANVAPWPLAACLRSADTSDDLLAYANLATSGGLGNASEWAKAEERWAKPMSFSDFISTIATLPWATKALSAAPPFGAVTSCFRISGNPGTLPRSEVLRSIHSAALRQHVARLILSHFGFPSSTALKGLEDPLADMQSWAEAAGQIPATLVAIGIRSSSDQESWLEWVDTVGHEQRIEIESAFISASHLDFFLGLYVQNPGCQGLLYWLRSIVANVDQLSPKEIRDKLRRAVVQALTEREVADANLRIDAILLRLWLGSLPDDMATTALDTIAEKATTEPSLWSQLVRFIDASALPPGLRESLLMNLFHRPELPRSNASAVIIALRRSLQSRRTGLSDPATWKRLGLPLPLPQRFAEAHPSFTLPDHPVVITRLAVQQIRGLADVTLELAPPPAEGQGQWTLVLGPNGAGKTTLLRATALALRNLADPKIWPKGTFATPWRALGATQSKIAVEIASGKTFEVTITKNGTETFARVPTGHPTPFPVFAYGCRRGSALGGAARAVDMKEDDGPEIATLFDEGAPLVHAETWLKEWQGAAATDPHKNGPVYDTVREALQELLGVDEVTVRDRQVFVSGPLVGNNIPFAALSDGYLTTAGWFLDLVARWIELATQHRGALTDGILGRMTGIVLLDEIDLHLHPRWQIEVIPRIKKLLPKMSFIVTTHNPLTLVGARPEEIWILATEGGLVRAERGTEAPMLLTGGQIYSRYFGIRDIYPNDLGEALRRYGFLSGDPLRTYAEEVEMEGLRAKLAAQGIEPGWEAAPRKAAPKPRKAAPKGTTSTGTKPAAPKRGARTKALPR